MEQVIKFEMVPHLLILKKARTHLDHGFFTEALDCYKKIMYIRECSEEAFSNIILCLSMLQDFEKFMKTFSTIDQENIITFISLQNDTFAKDNFLEEVCMKNDAYDFSNMSNSTKSEKTLKEQNIDTIKWESIDVDKLLDDTLMASLLKNARDNFLPVHKKLFVEILSRREFDCVKKQSVLEVLKFNDILEEFRYVKNDKEYYLIDLGASVLVNESDFVSSVIASLIDVLENDYIVDVSIIRYICMDYFCKVFPKPLVDEAIHLAYLYYRVLLSLGVQKQVNLIAKKFNVPYDELKKIINYV